MPNTAPRLTIAEFKKSPTAGALLAKQFAAEVKAIDSGEPNILELAISSSAVDRDNDTVDPAGGDFANYQKNPVVLWAHDSSSPPIAKSLAVWVEGSRIKARPQFTPKDLYPFGSMVYEMLKAGFINAASIGFIPREWAEAQREGFMPIDFKRWELMEWSVVPVPANPEAVMGAKAAGIDVLPLVEWAEKALDGETGACIWVPRQHVEAARKLAKGSPVIVTLSATTSGAVPYSKTALAAEDLEWDAAKEVEAADVAGLKTMCAWFDAEKPEDKGSYRLLHHAASDGHAVVWSGVSFAMGELLGSSGVPESDREKAFEHLAEHYFEFDKDPPEFKAVTTETTDTTATLPTATEEPSDAAETECAAAIEQVKAAALALNKAGRVLSAANESKLREARDLLSGVIVQVESESEERSAETPRPLTLDDVVERSTEAASVVPSRDEIRKTIRSVVTDRVEQAIRRASGRVD